MHALLALIAVWLSFTFELPEMKEYPRVELVAPAKIGALRYRGLATDRASTGTASEGPLDPGRDVMAVYDDNSRTIYLRDEWTGKTPAEVSVLVHEMVHHIQNLSGLKYECPQAREKPAYLAQERWLELFGKKLFEEFEIDPLSILVRTNCMD